jgi:hypothetical protein
MKKGDSVVAEKKLMRKLIVVRMPPISTVNITGFSIC